VKPGFLGIGRTLVVSAFCEKHKAAIDDPYVGCEACNAERPSVSLFLDALRNSDGE
jgi:hypothetical protein